MFASRTTLAGVAAAGSLASLGLAAAQQSAASAGVELPREVVEAASAFSAYMERTSGISGRFTSGEAVGEGLKAGVAYEPQQFEEGMIGFGALAALQDGRFVNGVETAAASEGGRAALAERIANDPAVVLRFSGAGGAVSRVEAALRARGANLFGAGRQIKQAAYEIQHEAWSNRAVADAAGRLAEVKSLSGAAATPSDDASARLISTVLSLPAPAPGAAPPATPVAVRALALAAEAELGAARNENLARLRPLLAETGAADCLRMSKLNLYQCMAVAGPQYEDVFCLGQHAMMDTGQCVSRAAGADAAQAQGAPPSPTSGDRPYIVPVAERSLAGGQ